MGACNVSACLFIAAYMEGASYDKVLDIFNGCPSRVHLDEYEMISCGNGCSQQGVPEHHNRFTAGAVLPAGATWRVAHSQANIPADSHPANQTLDYLSSGNDAYAIALRDGGAVLDALGDFGPDPGLGGWAVAGVNHATKDHTLIRINSTTEGNCGDWAASAAYEWEVFPKGTWPVQARAGSVASPSSPGTSSVSSPAPSGPSTQCDRAVTTTCGPTAAVAPAAALDRRPLLDRLVVAAWNAEWLFDGVCDPSVSPWNGGTGCVGFASGLNQCDAVGAAAHLSRMASRMAALNADVIHLAEVESCGMLDAVGRALDGGAAAYESLMVPGTDTFLRQQVGLVSRLGAIAPVDRSDARAAYPIDSASACGGVSPGSSDVSKHLIARLHLELPVPAAASATASGTASATLLVVGMHLKAIPTQPRSCHKREAQAKVMQAVLAAALAETDYVIAMGDLNDFDGDACCLDAPGSTPTSRVLRMLKDPRATGTDELHAVAERLPREARYTDWWDHAPADGVDQGLGEHSSLDHMLVSSALFARLASVQIDHTTAPMDYSDHWPLIATFNLSAGPPQLDSPTPPPLVCTAPRGLTLPYGAAAPILLLALVGAFTLLAWMSRCVQRCRETKAEPLMRQHTARSDASLQMSPATSAAVATSSCLDSNISSEAAKY